MNNTLAEQIAQFEPREGNWLLLGDLFEEVFSSDDATVYFPAIFNLFERFPNEDGAGVFWSALHGMEKVGGYERELVRYFRRFPSLMTKTMLIRIMNAGEKQVGGVPIELLVDKSE